MGDYATTTSIPQLLPNYLSGNTTTSDAGGVAVFAAHVTRAESLINGLIGVRYALPFIAGTTTTNVPPIIRTLTEDVACYYAMRASYNQDGKTKNPYLDEYERAMEMAGKIGSGEISMAYTNGSIVPAMATNRFLSSTKEHTPIFGLDSATAWQRDPDEIDEAEDARDEV